LFVMQNCKTKLEVKTKDFTLRQRTKTDLYPQCVYPNCKIITCSQTKLCIDKKGAGTFYPQRLGITRVAIEKIVQLETNSELVNKLSMRQSEKK